MQRTAVMKQIIRTPKAPKAIGAYSQAVKAGNLIFLSGQLPLDPETMELRTVMSEQIHQVFKNLQAVVTAAEGNLNNIVKLTIFLTDLSCFAEVNTIMSQYFQEPFPARSTIQVSKLPKDASIEIEAIAVLED